MTEEANGICIKCIKCGGSPMVKNYITHFPLGFHEERLLALAKILLKIHPLIKKGKALEKLESHTEFQNPFC